MYLIICYFPFKFFYFHFLEFRFLIFFFFVDSAFRTPHSALHTPHSAFSEQPLIWAILRSINLFLELLVACFCLSCSRHHEYVTRKPPEVHFTIRNRVPYNKQLTNRACSGRTGKYWPPSGQYFPVRPSRSVSKRLVFRHLYLYLDIDGKFIPLYLEIVFRQAFVFGHSYLYLDIEGKFFPLYLNKYTKRVKNSDALID